MLKLLIFNEQMRLKESSHSLGLLMKLTSNSKAASCPDGIPWEQLAIYMEIRARLARTLVQLMVYQRLIFGS